MVTTGANIIIPKFRPKEDRGWWQRIEAGIRLGVGQEKVLAENRMKDTARAERMIARKTVDGLGQLTAIIDPQVYLRWQHDQPGCWSDKRFGREFLRDNPECRAARPDKKYI